jgi:hypothetical protein
MKYQMEYREIETAPEDKKLSVVWGGKSSRPEYGLALRLSNQWFIYGESNPHANGRHCATPDGWLPRDRFEWTKAERRLCDILTMHPDLR